MAVAAVTQQPDAGSGVPATHGSGSGSGNFDIWTKSVGVTSLAASILAENGMIDDVVTLFDGDTVLATRILNIAIGAAITAKPTYLSADESAVQMFLGNQKCPSSPRASEIRKPPIAFGTLGKLNSCRKMGVRGLSGTTRALEQGMFREQKPVVGLRSCATGRRARTRRTSYRTPSCGRHSSM